MRLAEPLQACWKAHLALDFESHGAKTVLRRKEADGPLVVQKPFYPEGPAACHAIVVHPPGGIAGGDELSLAVRVRQRSSALLTTPGATKWYRSGGPWASQALALDVEGTLEWLPRETIVFDGALARLGGEIRLAMDAAYVGWEVVCLGRTGSGERFGRGRLALETRIVKGERLVWYERGEIEGGGAFMRSPAGLAGHSVFGTLIAAGRDLSPSLVNRCRQFGAVTLLPDIMVARYLGDSTEEALEAFTNVWQTVRPSVIGREAVLPRIWRT